MSARESFSSIWCNMKVPEVEVMVLNIMSPTYTLPHFLEDMQKIKKLSFIMCKIGIGFEKLSTDNPNVWPRLVEIDFDSCQDLVGFPELICNSVHLEKLSITNCNEFIEIPEEIVKLTSLETLGLRSCTKLEKLPDSISRLKKLSILDISDCLRLVKLPIVIVSKLLSTRKSRSQAANRVRVLASGFDCSCANLTSDFTYVLALLIDRKD
ncbi:hypothetical protein L1987_54797 [Smallanthus sonchifolius]|uniref:Uncharacterized protein n=1 Tax=Smallanthus sonchifolius TaxID=185202 RepID=A0ACB9E8J1_9ASTR|nr:hypothetical protein L1987_54797 [Smallanthus sonchifolius]